MESPKKREGHQLLLRFAEGSDLRDRLQQVAAASNRTLTQEILFRLEGSLLVASADENPTRTGGLKFAQAGKERSIAALVARLETLAARVTVLEDRLARGTIDR